MNDKPETQPERMERKVNYLGVGIGISIALAILLFVLTAALS